MQLTLHAAKRAYCRLLVEITYEPTAIYKRKSLVATAPPTTAKTSKAAPITAEKFEAALLPGGKTRGTTWRRPKYPSPPFGTTYDPGFLSI